MHFKVFLWVSKEQNEIDKRRQIMKSKFWDRRGASVGFVWNLGIYQSLFWGIIKNTCTSKG